MTILHGKQIDINESDSFDWKLKLLILSWEYPPNVVGGLSRHVNGLSVQLAAMGHDVHLLTAGIGDLPSFEKINGVNVHRVMPLNDQDDDFLTWIGGLNLAITNKAEKIAAETKFDLIHAHDWLVGSSAIILKEILAIPLLSTIHATEFGRNNGIFTQMQQFIHNQEQQLIAESDHVIVCSEYMKEELLINFLPTVEKISVLPNGIDEMDITIDLNEICPTLKNRRFVFSVGRMVKEKGFETIIDAAAIAKETGRNLFFVIAGKGPMLETYRQEARRRKLENHVAFIGYVTDEQRNALLLSSEMAVFPSLYEPFGIVALEAMILAKPTVVSETGGLIGIVKHLQTGMLMVPGDAHSLLENIDHLLNNPQTAKEIGNKGRKIAKSLYGWKRITLETVGVMKDTLLNKRVMDIIDVEAKTER